MPAAVAVPTPPAVPSTPDAGAAATATAPDTTVAVVTKTVLAFDIDVRPAPRIEPLAPMLGAEVQRFDGLTLSDFVRATSSDDWQRRFDDVPREIRLQGFERRDVVSVATGVSSAFSVGYVIWLLRGGVLLSSLVSSLPAWHLIDPLPVLGRTGSDDDEDEEDVDRLFRRNRPAAPPRPDDSHKAPSA